MNAVGIGIEAIEVDEGNETTVSSATTITVTTVVSINKEKAGKEREDDKYVLNPFNEGSGSVDVALFSTVVVIDSEEGLETEEPVRTCAITTAYIEGLVSRDANLETV